MTAQTQSLSSSEIHARTQACLASNDVNAMKALVAEVFSDSYHEDTQDGLVDAILSKDRLDMAQACFDPVVIKEWADANDEYLVLNCPNVFSYWAEQTPTVVAGVGKALECLPAQERLSILLGRSTSVAGAFLHGALVDDAAHWKNLTPAWLGEPESPTRQAAVDLGWQRAMLGAMVGSFLQVSSTASWLGALDYPYSLSLATLELQRIEGQKRRNQQRLQGGLVGKPINRVRIRFECDSNANPWDVELALALVEQTSVGDVVYLSPRTPRISPEDQACIKSIVEMHVSLGCLDVLVEALCLDEIPGVHEKTMNMALPESYNALDN